MPSRSEKKLIEDKTPTRGTSPKVITDDFDERNSHEREKGLPPEEQTKDDDIGDDIETDAEQIQSYENVTSNDEMETQIDTEEAPGSGGDVRMEELSADSSPSRKSPKTAQNLETQETNDLSKNNSGGDTTNIFDKYIRQEQQRTEERFSNNYNEGTSKLDLPSFTLPHGFTIIKHYTTKEKAATLQIPKKIENSRKAQKNEQKNNKNQKKQKLATCVESVLPDQLRYTKEAKPRVDILGTLISEFEKAFSEDPSERETDEAKKDRLGKLALIKIYKDLVGYRQASQTIVRSKYVNEEIFMAWLLHVIRSGDTQKLSVHFKQKDHNLTIAEATATLEAFFLQGGLERMLKIDIDHALKVLETYDLEAEILEDEKGKYKRNLEYALILQLALKTSRTEVEEFLAKKREDLALIQRLMKLNITACASYDSKSVIFDLKSSFSNPTKDEQMAYTFLHAKRLLTKLINDYNELPSILNPNQDCLPEEDSDFARYQFYVQPPVNGNLVILQLTHPVTSDEPKVILDQFMAKDARLLNLEDFRPSKQLVINERIEELNAQDRPIQDPIKYTILAQSSPRPTNMNVTNVTSRNGETFKPNHVMPCIMHTHFLIDIQGDIVPNRTHFLHQDTTLDIVSFLKFCSYCHRMGHSKYTCGTLLERDAKRRIPQVTQVPPPFKVPTILPQPTNVTKRPDNVQQDGFITPKYHRKSPSKMFDQPNEIISKAQSNMFKNQFNQLTGLTEQEDENNQKDNDIEEVSSEKTAHEQAALRKAKAIKETQQRKAKEALTNAEPQDSALAAAAKKNLTSPHKTPKTGTITSPNRPGKELSASPNYLHKPLSNLPSSNGAIIASQTLQNAVSSANSTPSTPTRSNPRHSSNRLAGLNDSPTDIDESMSYDLTQPPDPPDNSPSKKTVITKNVTPKVSTTSEEQVPIPESSDDPPTNL
ncbi:hypothetical protein CAAN3_16S00144 [[Candida] anglica]